MVIQAALLIAHLIAAPAYAALPAAPMPKAAIQPVQPAPLNLKLERPAHHFYDRTAKIELTAALALDAWDNVQTCRSLDNGGQPRLAYTSNGVRYYSVHREMMLPSQSCPGVTLMLAAQLAGQEALAYLLHRTNHHKLEKAVRFFSIEENTQGVLYGAFHAGTLPWVTRRVP
jgi:hypothetical protein